MLQNPRKTLGFKENMVYKIPPGGGGGKPYPASGLVLSLQIYKIGWQCVTVNHLLLGWGFAVSSDRYFFTI